MTDARARRLALAGIVGPAVFGAAALVGGFRESNYSPVHNYVSQLAATGSGWRGVMTAGFMTLGVCTLGFAVAVRVLRPAALLLVLLIALSGAGTLMAGSFGCDPGCPTKGDMTTHQELHNVSSVITFSAWIVAPLVGAWQLRGTRFARVSLAVGLFLLAFGSVLGAHADAGPDDPVGLWQRVELVGVGAWFVVFALDLRRGRAPAPASLG